MKVLITGATGFIGSALTRLAVARGHQVAALVNPATAAARRLNDEEGLAWLHGTLAAPPWKPIEQFAAEVCVHAAWITTPGLYLEAPENANYLEWSVAFAQRLRSMGMRRFVGLGTCIEYRIDPKSNQLLKEDDTPIEPASFYAQCKNALRLALEEEAAQDNDFALSWARIFYPYGPGEHPDRLCTSLIRKFANNEEVILRTPSSTKDYVYIDDLACALLVLLESDSRGIINIATSKGTKVATIAASIATLLDKKNPCVDFNNSEIAADYVVGDATKLRTLGWEPRHSLDEGLRAMISQGL